MTEFHRTASEWQKVGNVNPGDLKDSRLQLHWACQIPSSVGTTLLPAREDDSQTNLEWVSTRGLFAGEPVGRPPVRGALEPATLTLMLQTEDGTTKPAFDLGGKNYADGMRWMQETLEDFLRSPLPKPLRRRELDIPQHRVGESGNEPFSAPEDHLTELARWFANADLLQRELAASIPGSSPIRCWPHHFDIGMLVSLEPAKGFEGKAIGVGLSPGDDNYDEPYWYVNPYPSPSPDALPALGEGHWHTTGWIGAVLTASEIVRVHEPGDQASLCTRYVRSAFETCTAILGAKTR